MGVEGDEAGGTDVGVDGVGHEAFAEAGEDNVVRQRRKRREVGHRVHPLV